MPNKDRSFHESPEKAGGEGWLYSEQQQKLCHFKPDTATVHPQWVAIRAYSYVPPRPPSQRSWTGHLRLVEGRMVGKEIQEVKEGEADLLCPAVA